jgi:hypothetical protein
MIDMTSRTGSIAIWPSCIMFGVSFPAPKGRFVSALAVFVFTHCFSGWSKSPKRSPSFWGLIS